MLVVGISSLEHLTPQISSAEGGVGGGKVKIKCVDLSHAADLPHTQTVRGEHQKRARRNGREDKFTSSCTWYFPPNKSSGLQRLVHSSEDKQNNVLRTQIQHRCGWWGGSCGGDRLKRRPSPLVCPHVNMDKDCQIFRWLVASRGVTAVNSCLERASQSKCAPPAPDGKRTR